MYLRKLMKNAAMLLCAMAMISVGGEAQGMEVQAREIPFQAIDGVCVGAGVSSAGDAEGISVPK